MDWLTYRRGAPGRHRHAADPLPPGPAPASPGECVTLTDETVTITDYGQCRQRTLYENGTPTLQVLTSDTTAPAAALLAWLRCRWRTENVLRYLTAHHGLDWLCHYGADTGTDTALIDNPARKAARTILNNAQITLADAQRALAQQLGSDASVAGKNAALPTAEKKITNAERALATVHQKLKLSPRRSPPTSTIPTWNAPSCAPAGRSAHHRFARHVLPPPFLALGVMPVVIGLAGRLVARW